MRCASLLDLSSRPSGSLSGSAPPGDDFLVLGHERLGVVEQVGPAVTELAAGDHVVAMVRRPSDSICDAVGMPDMSTDDQYHERGISRLHGFLTEHYVEAPEFLMPVPKDLREVAVLLEPLTHPVSGLDAFRQAFQLLAGEPGPVKIFVEVARPG